MPTPHPKTNSKNYYGWRVVYAAFVLAIFGWGLGFYGPPVFMGVLLKTRGWPVVAI